MEFEYQVLDPDGNEVDAGILSIIGLMTKDFSYIVEGYTVSVALLDEDETELVSVH